MKKTLGDKYFSGVAWVLIDKFGGGGINFLVTIILARLLAPEDFGLIAMVMIFFDLSTTFIESGFSTALIREKTISEIDKSTTFVFNFLASILLYGILFFGAPAIADFFNEWALVSIIRIMGLILIINSFSIIQQAVFTQKIDFKTLAKVRMVTIVISSTVAVIMAFSGYGVWSLVAQYGLMSLINTIILCFINRWVPSFKFSHESFHRLFNFGSKILLGGILDRIYRHIYQLLIGKFFTASILGFYSQASNFKKMTILTLFETINKVTYPLFAKMQDDREVLKSTYRKIIKLNSFLIVQAMVMIGILAKPFIVLLIGEKWLPSVPILQLLCLSGVIYHFSRIFHNALLAIGRSDITLRLEIVFKVSITIAIVIGMNYGLYGLIAAEVVSAYINLMINAYYSNKYLGYTYAEQFRDIAPTYTFSILIGALIIFFGNILPMPMIMHFVLSVVMGISAYFLLHYMIRSDEIGIIRDTIIPKTLKFISSAKVQS